MYRDPLRQSTLPLAARSSTVEVGELPRSDSSVFAFGFFARYMAETEATACFQTPPGGGSGGTPTKITGPTTIPTALDGIVINDGQAQDIIGMD